MDLTNPTPELLHEIDKFLDEVHTPGTDRHRLAARSPYFLYRDFADLFDDEGEEPPTYEAFSSMFDVFTSRKRCAQISPEQFLVRLSGHEQTKKPLDVSAFPKIPKFTGKRKPSHDEHKYLYDRLMELISTNYLDLSLMMFVTRKSYLLERYISEDRQSITYATELLRLAWFLPEDEEGKAQLEAYLHELNGRVLAFIDFFKNELQHHFENNKDKPKFKTWFADLFEEKAVRLLPDWEQCQGKASNIPNFRKSYDGEFIGFTIQGLPFSRFGYTQSTYHNFQDKLLQGLIYLLYRVYLVVYGQADAVWAKEREILEQFTEILDSLSPDIRASVLARLTFKYSPEPSAEIYPLIRVLRDLPPD